MVILKPKNGSCTNVFLSKRNFKFRVQIVKLVVYNSVIYKNSLEVFMSIVLGESIESDDDGS